MLLLSLAIAAVALSGSSASSAGRPSNVAITEGPFAGVGVGVFDGYRRVDNSTFASDSTDVYRGRFLYSFRISDGVVEGTGNGVYQEATWHLRGTHFGVGRFDCRPPMTAKPFAVVISGTATEQSIKLRFELVGAKEANADYDCGSKFTGYATDDSRLARGLKLAQGDGITVSRTNPSIPRLSKVELIGGAGDRRVILHEWAFSIRAPGAPPPPPPQPPTTTGDPLPRAEDDCTITGTPGNDTLSGTPKRDIICGKAGNDVIRGVGGHDTLRGDAGNDRLFGGKGNDSLDGGAGTDSLLGDDGRDLLLARDSRLDTLDGGRHRDWAARDRRLDRVRNVEVLG